MAREVHDVVGYSLTVIAIQADAARRLWDHGGQKSTVPKKCWLTAPNTSPTQVASWSGRWIHHGPRQFPPHCPLP